MTTVSELRSSRQATPRLERMKRRTLTLSVALVASCTVYFGRQILWGTGTDFGFESIDLTAVVLCFVGSLLTFEYPEIVRPLSELGRRRASRSERRIQPDRVTQRYVHDADELSGIVRLETLGALAPSLRHELANSLMAMLGYVQLLKNGASSEQLPLVESLERVAKAAAGTLTSTFAMLESGGHDPSEVVSVKDVVAEVIEVANRLSRARAEVVGRPIRVETDVQEAFSRVGRQELRQTLLNLVINAVEAMPFGGQLKLASRVHNGQVSISISDSGIGMSDEVQAKIFEPLYTTKPTGTGLGLAVAKAITERYGGGVTFVTRPGHGSEFTVTIPAAASPVDQAHSSETSRPGEAQRQDRHGRVVVVEDDLDALKALAGNLQAARIDVLACGSGGDALREIRRSPGDIDLVLTDFAMPDISGVALAEEIRRIAPSIKVVLLTGWDVHRLYSDDELRSKGVELTVSKPIDPGQLVDLVAKMRP